MGFYDDISKIISFLPKKRQSLLFSATMPPQIRELTRKILNKPKEINIGLAKPPEKIKQEAYVVFEDQKMQLVPFLVKDPELKSILIFGDTKSSVKQLSRQLKKVTHGVEEIHSDLDQPEREAVMNRFKSRQTRILVATDIISRGIDVEDIDLVINYDVPHDAEDYVHRIGRTARAENLGRACTLIGPREQIKFASIERLLGKRIDKTSLPGDLGKGPDYKPEKYKSENPGKKRFVRRKKKPNANRR
jgi:ATP-dependent RNA helicase RhlE